jgi:hypothetical protein
MASRLKPGDILTWAAGVPIAEVCCRKKERLVQSKL